MRMNIAVVSLLLPIAVLAADDQLTPAVFVKQASQAGMAEVALGKLALEKSTNDRVQAFAKTMVADHTKANGTLDALAHRENLAVSTSLDPEEAAALKTLGGLSGAEFDRAYAGQMMRDHQTAVALFQNASTDQALSAALRQFAADTLPSLQHHLDEARELDQSVGNRAAAR